MALGHEGSFRERVVTLPCAPVTCLPLKSAQNTPTAPSARASSATTYMRSRFRFRFKHRLRFSFWFRLCHDLDGKAVRVVDVELEAQAVQQG